MGICAVINEFNNQGITCNGICRKLLSLFRQLRYKQDDVPCLFSSTTNHYTRVLKVSDFRFLHLVFLQLHESDQLFLKTYFYLFSANQRNRYMLQE